MKFGFIGAGKVGTALGIYFQKKGYEIIGYYSRTLDSAKWAAKLTNSKSFKIIDDLVKEVDFLFVTTNDDQIEFIDKKLACCKSLNQNHIVAHASGVYGSDILKEVKKVGCSLYSIHPLQSFSEPCITVEKLDITVFTLEGDDNKMNIIKAMLDKTNNNYFIIDKEFKPLYHAGACIISNYLVTLLNIGFNFFEKAGIDRDKIFNAMEPLIYGTLDNIKNSNTIEALTGPIVRGDEKTILYHLENIQKNIPEELEFYKNIGLKTIEMIEGNRMDSIKAEKIKKILEGD